MTPALPAAPTARPASRRGCAEPAPLCPPSSAIPLAPHLPPAFEALSTLYSSRYLAYARLYLPAGTAERTVAELLGHLLTHWPYTISRPNPAENAWQHLITHTQARQHPLPLNAGSDQQYTPSSSTTAWATRSLPWPTPPASAPPAPPKSPAVGLAPPSAATPDDRKPSAGSHRATGGSPAAGIRSRHHPGQPLATVFLPPHGQRPGPTPRGSAIASPRLPMTPPAGAPGGSSRAPARDRLLQSICCG